jgi:hypothetical protein
VYDNELGAGRSFQQSCTTFLSAVGLYTLMVEQTEDVVEAEINGIHVPCYHDVEQQLCEFKLDTVAVGTDDLLQGIGVNQFRVEPHPAFLGG